MLTEAKVYMLNDYANSNCYNIFIEGIDTLHEAMIAVSSAMSYGSISGLEKLVTDSIIKKINTDYDSSVDSGLSESIDEQDVIMVGGLPTLDGVNYGIDLSSKMGRYITAYEFIKNYKDMNVELSDDERDAMILARIEPLMCNRVKLIIADDLSDSAFIKHSMHFRKDLVVSAYRPEGDLGYLDNYDWYKLDENDDYCDENDAQVEQEMKKVIGDKAHEYIGFILWGFYY